MYDDKGPGAPGSRRSGSWRTAAARLPLSALRARRLGPTGTVTHGHQAFEFSESVGGLQRTRWSSGSALCRAPPSRHATADEAATPT